MTTLQSPFPSICGHVVSYGLGLLLAPKVRSLLTKINSKTLPLIHYLLPLSLAYRSHPRAFINDFKKSTLWLFQEDSRWWWSNLHKVDPLLALLPLAHREVSFQLHQVYFTWNSGFTWLMNHATINPIPKCLS